MQWPSLVLSGEMKPSLMFWVVAEMQPACHLTKKMAQRVPFGNFAGNGRFPGGPTFEKKYWFSQFTGGPAFKNIAECSTLLLNPLCCGVVTSEQIKVAKTSLGTCDFVWNHMIN